MKRCDKMILDRLRAWRKNRKANGATYVFPYFCLLDPLLDIMDPDPSYDSFAWLIFLVATYAFVDFSTTPDRDNSLANWALVLTLALAIFLLRNILAMNWVRVVLYGILFVFMAVQFMKFFKRVKVETSAQ